MSQIHNGQSKHSGRGNERAEVSLHCRGISVKILLKFKGKLFLSYIIFQHLSSFPSSVSYVCFLISPYFFPTFSQHSKYLRL
jgi:hypothetical protein